MLHTPTSQPLFIRHKSAAELLEKQAAAVARMPDDDKRWPAQVLSEMHKQLPFLSKFDVDIEMTRIEPEAGYALGYAMLRNKTGKQRAAEELGKPTNKIRVPVIVADRLLQPFHVFEVGGKTYPLTQERVESAMMNPSMFDGISDPPGTQSLLDQIYPPFQHRQGYGMMSGDRATTGLSKLSSAPRVTKTASGESGPLREFLRQQEVEKTAIFTPQAVAKGVPGAVKSFENLAAKRVAGVIKPPVRPTPVTHSSPQPFIPPTVKITDKLTGTTRSIQNGSDGFLLPSARPSPVKTLRDTTLTDPRSGQQVTLPRVDPRFSNFNGPLPPARPGSTASGRTTGSAPAVERPTLSAERATSGAPPEPELTYSDRLTIAPRATTRPATTTTPVAASGTPGGRDMLPVGPEGVLSRPEWTPTGGFSDLTGARFELTEPTLARVRGGATPGAAARDLHTGSAARGTGATDGLPVTTGPSGAGVGSRSAEVGTAREAPTSVSGTRADERTVAVSRGDAAATGARELAPESGISGLAGMNDTARAAFLQQHGLNPNISPTGLAQLEQGFGQWAAAPGNAGKTFQDYIGALPQQSKGFLGGVRGPEDAVARAPAGKAAPGFLGSAAGGATMLGLGALGGGMMMANKASENY